jgi:hypothetical protein
LRVLKQEREKREALERETRKQQLLEQKQRELEQFEKEYEQLNNSLLELELEEKMSQQECIIRKKLRRILHKRREHIQKYYVDNEDNRKIIVDINKRLVEIDKREQKLDDGKKMREKIHR